MPAGKFDPELKVDAKGYVMAGGPLDVPTDKVVEMCVWVFQRHGPNDAIANKMLPGPEAAEAEHGYGMGQAVTIRKNAAGNIRWELLLDDRMGRKAEFTECSATALAIGVFEDVNGHETAFVWSEAVELEVATPAATPA